MLLHLFPAICTESGKIVHNIASGALFFYLERMLTLEVICAMAEPERVVCLDVGFAGNDQIKANAAPMFKTGASPAAKQCEVKHANDQRVLRHPDPNVLA